MYSGTNLYLIDTDAYVKNLQLCSKVSGVEQIHYHNT